MQKELANKYLSSIKDGVKLTDEYISHALTVTGDCNKLSGVEKLIGDYYARKELRKIKRASMSAMQQKL